MVYVIERRVHKKKRSLPLPGVMSLQQTRASSRSSIAPPCATSTGIRRPGKRSCPSPSPDLVTDFLQALADKSTALRYQNT